MSKPTEGLLGEDRSTGKLGGLLRWLRYDRSVEARELTILFVSGGALIVFGLVPGLLDGLKNGIRSFSASLSLSLPALPSQVGSRKHSHQFWLAAIGFALILIGLLDFSMPT